MAYDPERITFFAKTDARGQNVPFGIKAKDRTRHVYVIGKTGMGKSTLLENMAVQDIKNGEGFAFIDPHGQTAETLLDYIPPERVKDVVYFAPHDMEYPVAFNVMEDVGADKRHLVVSGLMSVFEKIWVDAWSARMAYILQNTLMALLEYPDSTLLGVNRMLSDKNYRKKVVDNITDPAVKSFWVDEFAKYNERYMQEAGDAIKNKTGQFSTNPVLRNIIGQPKSSFDIRKIMDERKILIMNLSKGLIGETNANLLGSMLTTRIYLAAMSRADTSPKELEQMPNFYFYVDEFQSFANSTFANILSESRKYKLNLTIAHQYIEQMEEDVRNAVFGNVGTIVSFRVGPFDAEVLETIYAPKFYAVDLCNLSFAQVYLTLMIDGIGSAPFSATTLPPIEHSGSSCKEMIVHSSREQFAFKRELVEDIINRWHGVGVEEETQTDKKPPAADSRPPRPAPRAPKDPHPAEKRISERGERGERNGRSPDRNGQNGRNENGRPKPKPEKDQQPPKSAPKTKNLDELRAVLRNMAGDADSSSTEAKKPAKANKEKQEKRPDDANGSKEVDLREALSSVIKEDDTPKTDSKRANRNKNSDTKTNETDKTDDLNPKQLERMMRVKTNDKTPIK